MNQIQPLDQFTLLPATLLRDAIFTDMTVLEKETLSASIDPKKYEKWFPKIGVTKLEYWVHTDAISDSISGLIGLYNNLDDESDEIWLGWYCVNPELRGQGIGDKLLDFAINESRSRGKKVLNLYTTNEDKYASARRLYEKRGFIDVSKKKSNLTRFYRLTLD